MPELDPTDLLHDLADRARVASDPLAPVAVRRLGARRRRRRTVLATGGAFVVAGLAAAAVAVLPTDPHSAPLPPTGPAPTTAPPTAQATAPAQPQPSQDALATDPFLRGEDLGGIGAYTGFFRSGVDAELTSQERVVDCLPDLTTLGASQVRAAQFSTDLEGMVLETVLQFPDADAATATTERLRAIPSSCEPLEPESAETVGPVADVAVADGGFQFPRLLAPNPSQDLGSEGSFNGVAVVREGNLVVVLEFHAVGDPYGGERQAWSDSQLAAALARAAGR